MTDRDDHFRRGDARERTRRDMDRFRRREPGARFWRSLALVGSVGWPIVLLATGGAMLGRHLDDRFGTGVRFTLILLTIGTVLGSHLAYRALRGDGS
jgi:predicted F0F1-ATPase subunit